jgi:single-stranded-DNA-specific exonuclease
VRPYIPHRVEEGYGLNDTALQDLAAQGTRVLVTVDCGIRSVHEVALAVRLGMDVVITDHHSPGPRLPDALSIIAPRQSDCPYLYKSLAGVGLAYKLAQALLRSYDRVPIHREHEVYLEEDDLLDLVALGTIADLAPLTGENRLLVRRGLKRMNTAPRPGVEALIRQAGRSPGTVDEDSVSYSLAPRLNAAGRIDHAEMAYQLLITEYSAEAERLAHQLNTLNRERQRMTSEALEQAHQAVLAEGQESPLLFVSHPDIPMGVVGLVASRLVDEFYRPAIVVEWGEEESRGSARSIPEFHVTQALEQCEDLLVRYGGHKAAAGFTIRTANLEELKSRLLSLAGEALDGWEPKPTLKVDAQVPLQSMSWELWEGLQGLRPFGEENPEPLFASQNVVVHHQRAVGGEGTHLKLRLFDGRAVWDGIAFRQGEWAGRLPERVDVAYHLQINEWRGERRLQLNVQDIRPRQ